MTLDQLETFINVADSGSFKAASEVLNRSQPALSVAVKKLEEELGIQLFSRKDYRPKLTDSGVAFYHKARELYRNSQSLKRYAQMLGHGLETQISLALDSLVPMDSILKVLKEFSDDHPDTKLNLSFEVLGGASEKVKDNEVQMAIGPNIGLNSSEYEKVLLTNVNMIPVYARALHQKLNQAPDLMNELKSLPQIIVRDSAKRPDERTYGVLDGARQWSVQSMNTKKDIILAGLGWGRLPEHMVRHELSANVLVEVNELSLRREKVEMCLFRSEKHPMGPLSLKLWELFMNLRV